MAGKTILYHRTRLKAPMPLDLSNTSTNHCLVEISNSIGSVICNRPTISVYASASCHTKKVLTEPVTGSGRYFFIPVRLASSSSLSFISRAALTAELWNLSKKLPSFDLGFFSFGGFGAVLT